MKTDMTSQIILLACVVWSRLSTTFSSSTGGDNDGGNFTCVGKVIGGYYADVKDNCQTFHVCTLGENNALNDIVIRCLEGTVFEQETRVCERTEEVNCAASEDFYHLNNDLYGPGIIPDSALSENTDDIYSGKSIQSETLPLSPMTWADTIRGVDKSVTTTDNNYFLENANKIIDEADIVKKLPCHNKRDGYVYGDHETGCIMFHYCYRNLKNKVVPATFMCDEGLLFDDVTGKCKPAKYVKCIQNQARHEVVKELCLHETTGRGFADPRTQCRFYTRTLIDGEGKITQKIPCLCPEAYAFSEKTQRCEVANEVKCQNLLVNTKKVIYTSRKRSRRMAGPQMDNDLMQNDFPDNPRAQRALENLADLNKWAQQNSDHSLFVDMYELQDSKIIKEYPKKSPNDNLSRTSRIISSGRLNRRKRSPSSNTSSNNTTKADELNSLINVTSLDPIKDSNKTNEDNKHMETEVPKLMTSEKDDETKENIPLVESISEASINTSRKNEAMVVSKNSFQEINEGNKKNVLNKPIITSQSKVEIANKQHSKPNEETFTEPLSINSGSENMEGIRDADMIEFIQPESSHSTMSKIQEKGLTSTSSPATTKETSAVTTTESTTARTTQQTTTATTPITKAATLAVTNNVPSTTTTNAKEAITTSTTVILGSMVTSSNQNNNSIETTVAKDSNSSTDDSSNQEKTNTTVTNVSTTKTSEIPISSTTMSTKQSSITTTATPASEATTNAQQTTNTSQSLTNVTTTEAVSTATSVNTTTVPPTPSITTINTTVSNASVGIASTTVIPNVTTTISTLINHTTTEGSAENSTHKPIIPPGPYTLANLPETTFTCKGKKLEQFYPDPEVNCQAFHYCSPGFRDNQVLDLKFLCKGATKFDLKSQKCVDMNMVTCDLILPIDTSPLENTTDTNSTKFSEKPQNCVDMNVAMCDVTPESTITSSTTVSSTTPQTEPTISSTTSVTNKTTIIDITPDPMLSSTHPTSTIGPTSIPELTANNSLVNMTQSKSNETVENTTTILNNATSTLEKTEKTEDTKVIEPVETTIPSLVEVDETSEPVNEVFTEPPDTEEPTTDESIPNEDVSTTDNPVEERSESTTIGWDYITQIVSESSVELKLNHNTKPDLTTETTSFATSKSKTEVSHSISTNNDRKQTAVLTYSITQSS